MNYWIIFLTGLTVGGLTCLAVQGGLLATCIAKRSERGSVPAISSFLISKLVAYTLLGFLLGYFGSLIELSLQMQAALQIFAGVFMLAVVANLLDIHPIFRYVIIQPPKFVTRLVRNEAKSQAFFAPALLGASTVLIPCGTTQAMMVLAISSGNIFAGALIMFLFTLGASPLFFILAYGFSKFGEFFQAHFAKVAAYLVLVVSVLAINNGIVLTGSPFTLQGLREEIFLTLTVHPVQSSATVLSAKTVNGIQEATIRVAPTSYTPNNLTVRAGIPVRLTLVTNGIAGCTRAFTIPSLGIRKILPDTGVETVEFTPDKPGPIRFTCSMGMFGGTITVI